MPVSISGTNGITNATWTTAGRPSAPNTGQQGYNTTTNLIDYYNGTSWQSVAPTSGLPITASYLIVAGGGSGGNSTGYSEASGGGGAGGLLTGSISLTSGTVYTATVGAGGAGVSTYSGGNNGSNTTFTGVTTDIGGGA